MILWIFSVIVYRVRYRCVHMYVYGCELIIYTCVCVCVCMYVVHIGMRACVSLCILCMNHSFTSPNLSGGDGQIRLSHDLKNFIFIFLSLRVFRLLSSSSLIYSQHFGRCILCPSSGASY